MKRILYSTAFLVVVSIAGNAQNDSSADIATDVATAVKAGDKIAANTQVTGKLQSELNAEKAKVGDQVLLKTTKDVKQNGQVVISKGAMLAGRVTEVSKKAKGNAVSKIGLVFDELRQNGSSISINALVTSIIEARANALVSEDAMMTSSTSARSSSGSTASGGGLLGGVTNTVGGVANTATGAVSGIAGTATQTVGSTTAITSGTLKGLQISSSTGASASGSSTLSMEGQNLRLEKGTTFNLSVSNSSTVNGSR